MVKKSIKNKKTGGMNRSYRNNLCNRLPSQSYPCRNLPSRSCKNYSCSSLPSRPRPCRNLSSFRDIPGSYNPVVRNYSIKNRLDRDKEYQEILKKWASMRIQSAIRGAEIRRSILKSRKTQNNKKLMHNISSNNNLNIDLNELHEEWNETLSNIKNKLFSKYTTSEKKILLKENEPQQPFNTYYKRISKYDNMKKSELDSHIKEMLKRTDVPNAVSINNAVEIILLERIYKLKKKIESIQNEIKQLNNNQKTSNLLRRLKSLTDKLIERQDELDELYLDSNPSNKDLKALNIKRYIRSEFGSHNTNPRNLLATKSIYKFTVPLFRNKLKKVLIELGIDKYFKDVIDSLTRSECEDIFWELVSRGHINANFEVLI